MDFEKRARELVEQMTLEERASQLRFDAPAIERLGIPRYHWWNEALHGLARAGTATMFPQAIGLAAMFDAEEMRRIASSRGKPQRMNPCTRAVSPEKRGHPFLLLKR